MKNRNTQANEWQLVEPEKKTEGSPPARIDLYNPTEIRREMGKVYRDMRTGKILAQDGTRLAYVLDMIRKAYETDVLQEKIALIEQTLKMRNKP